MEPKQGILFLTDKISLTSGEIAHGEKDGTQCVIVESIVSTDHPIQHRVIFTEVAARALHKGLGEYLAFLDEDKDGGG